MWDDNEYTKYHVLRYWYNRMPITARSILRELVKDRNENTGPIRTRQA